MKEQLLEGFSFDTYKEIDDNITKYYTTEDQLYNTNEVVESHTDTFALSTKNAITINCNENFNAEPEYTYYISNITNNSDSPKSYIVDVHNNTGTIRSKDGCQTNDVLTISRRKLQLSNINNNGATPFDPNNMYYRVDNVIDDTNYKLIGDVIVFNNIHSGQTSLTVKSKRYTRSPDRKYYHGANDGIFEIENKNSLANAMNNDVKVMIKQNEQLMILGTLTAATFLVGAYVLMRN